MHARRENKPLNTESLGVGHADNALRVCVGDGVAEGGMAAGTGDERRGFGDVVGVAAADCSPYFPERRGWVF